MRCVTRRLPLASLALVLCAGSAAAQTGGFTMEQVKAYPFPDELTANATGSQLAWTLNERGLRNIWVADGAGSAPRRLT
jgi:hypothetical protein